MRVVSVLIDILAPDDITDDEVLTAVNQMLDVGAADAKDTAEDEDIDNPDAEVASRLEVGHPTLLKVE